jgi:hypothetical protein
MKNTLGAIYNAGEDEEDDDDEEDAKQNYEVNGKELRDR